MAAPACYDHALDFCPATKTRFPIALVDTVPELELATLAVGIDIVGNGGAAETNCFGQNLADCPMEPKELFPRQIFGDASRMQTRAEQALVCIDVANAAQNFLVEQQRLDAGAPRSEVSAEILGADFERLVAQMSLEIRQLRLRDEKHAAEAPDVRIAQLSPIVEDKEDMRMRRNGFPGTDYFQLASHPKMDDKIGLRT